MKTRQGTIRLIPLSLLKMPPLNEMLYRPILPTDPDVVALAESIRKNGILQPLAVTTDNFILSGNRRYVASKMLGLTTVPYQPLDFSSEDPRFLELLREHNRQRVKTTEEVFREELVSMDVEESYRLLVEHRKQKARINADTITIEGTKRRAKITQAKQPFLDAILKILDDRQDYWPLTDRQIHYALLNDPPLIHASKPGSTYQNNVASYKATCELATRARLEGLIPWEAIDDPTRPITVWQCHASVGPFIRQELDDFLKGYYRDLLQSQPNQIEIVGEKNTISNIIKPVAMEYRIPMTTGRGYCSSPPRKKMAKRFRESGKERLVLLVLSDFDPEGEDIPHSYARSMRDEFHIEQIDAIKVALTAEQVDTMHLPVQMQAKKDGSRYQKFSERYGDDVFELEAIPPDTLQQLLRDAIDSVLDVDAFNAEIDAEKKDIAHLNALRQAIKKDIDGVVGQLDPPPNGRSREKKT